MIHYRKTLELYDEGISFRGISASIGNSRQKVTEVIQLAEKKGLMCPLDEEMDDRWIEDFLFPEKSLEAPDGSHSTLNTFIKSWPNRTLLCLFYSMNTKQKAGRIIKSLTRIEALSAIIAIMPRNTKLPCVSAESLVKY
jgi:hypothetical protein